MLVRNSLKKSAEHTVFIALMAFLAVLTAATFVRPATGQEITQPMIVADPRLVETIEELAGTSNSSTVLTLPIAIPWQGKRTDRCAAAPIELRLGRVDALPPVRGQAGTAFDLDRILMAIASPKLQDQYPNHLIIIAKSGSECVSAACSLTRVLKHQNSGLRIDVAAPAEARPGLSCIADNTGGEFWPLSPNQAAAELAALFARYHPEPAALPLAAADHGTNVQQTQRTASTEQTQSIPLPRPAPAGAITEPGDTGRTASPLPERQETRAFAWARRNIVAPEAGPVEATEVSGVSVRVLAGPNGPVISSDLSHAVFSDPANGAEPLLEFTEANPVFPLPKGKYTLQTTHHGVVRRFPFSVSADGTAHLTVSLNMGYLSLSAVARKGGQPLAADITYFVSRLQSQGGTGTLMRQRGAQAVFALPAGHVRVSARLGRASKSRDIAVAPGDTLEHRFNFALGVLRIQTNAPLAETALLEILPQPNRAQGAGGGAFTISPEETAEAMQLAGGDYRLRLLRGGTVAFSTDFSIEPGKLTTVSLPDQRS